MTHGPAQGEYEAGRRHALRWRGIGGVVILGGLVLGIALVWVSIWASSLLPSPWRWIGIPVAVALVFVGGMLGTLGEIIGLRAAHGGLSLGGRLDNLSTLDGEGQWDNSAAWVSVRLTEDARRIGVLEMFRLTTVPDGAVISHLSVPEGVMAAGGDVLSPRVWSAGGAVPSAQGAPDVGVTLYGEGFAGAPTGLIPLVHPLLHSGWLVDAKREALALAYLTPSTARAFNTGFQDHIAVALHPANVIAYTDAHREWVDPQLMLVMVQELRQARPEPAQEAATGQAQGSSTVVSDEEWDSLRGTSQSRGVARNVHVNRDIVGMAATFGALIAPFWRSPQAQEVAFQSRVTAGVLFAVGLVMILSDNTYSTRQQKAASAVLTLARERGWRYVQRDPMLEAGWARRPFSSVARLTASPAARGEMADVAGSTGVGVAYIEGDLGRWPLLRGFSARVAWADVPQGLPAVDIVREGFMDKVVTSLGGADLDVESYAFNAAWRVKAEDPRAAHALLTPAVIAVLNEVAAEDRLAFHLDAGRVVLWDDARRSQGELAARVGLAQRFAAALPRFVSESG